MKKFLSVIVLFSFIVTLIPGNIYGQDDSEKEPRIAVLPLEDTNISAKKEGFGTAIAGMLTTELINGKVFKVIERNQIDRMLQEMAFQISGAVDSKTAKEIGNVLGVDILVFGNVAKFDPLVETDIRLIDTQSGEALLAEHASSESGVEIRNMVEKLARKIEQRYMGRLTELVTISSDPSKAMAYVDGVMEGETPLTKNLNQGPHKIRIVKKDYTVWEQNIVVIKGENNINAKLNVDPKIAKRLAEKERLEKEKQRQSQLTKKRTDNLNMSTKKGSNKTLLYIIGGAIIVGGGVAALTLAKDSGDDSKDTNNNSNVNITITIP